MKLGVFGVAILCLVVSTLTFSDTPGDSREAFKRDEINAMDDGDLCPKTSNKKYHHHFVLVDTTSPLRPSQVELIRRLVLPEQYLESLAPWDRVSIMRMMSIKPAKNRPLFSKCRPRSGDPASRYEIDKHDWKFESASDLSVIYQKFVKGIKETIDEIENPKRLTIDTSDDALSSSPIMSQIKEISRMWDLDFSEKSGYESRKLTIVSDLAQNTVRLPFYEKCPPATLACPTWQEFKDHKKYARAVKRLMPAFGENVEVELIYLNSNFDKDLNKNILDFWYDFFEDAGITDISDRIESDEG